MKVYTYFSPVPEIKDDGLLKEWAKSWQKHGWETVILGEIDAKRADPYMYDRFNKSPLLLTRNPREYTRAAMLRWIPMTQLSEPALHVDIDVMCNGLKPEDIIIHDPLPTFLAGSTCPCAVAANPRGWKLFCAMLELAPFLPNFHAEELAADSCDQWAMHIARQLMPECFFIQPRWANGFDEDPLICSLYNEDAGWEHAKTIHFPNRLTPQPRVETVRRVLGELQK